MDGYFGQLRNRSILVEWVQRGMCYGGSANEDATLDPLLFDNRQS